MIFFLADLGIAGVVERAALGGGEDVAEDHDKEEEEDEYELRLGVQSVDDGSEGEDQARLRVHAGDDGLQSRGEVVNGEIEMFQS